MGETGPDHRRRRGARDERCALLARDLDEAAPGPDALFDPEAVDDDVLTLTFGACHLTCPATAATPIRPPVILQ